MEHLSFPRGAPLASEQVKYEGSSDYIGISFSEYAISCGYEFFLDSSPETILSSLLFVRKKAKEDNSRLRKFLHTWLFGSLLQEFFRRPTGNGATYRHDDFVVPIDVHHEETGIDTVSVCCTAKLLGLLSLWREEVKGMSTVDARDLHMRLSRLLNIVERAFETARNLWEPSPRRVICSIAEELESAMNSVFGKLPFNFELKTRAWGFFGWCPNDVERMVRNLSNNAFLLCNTDALVWQVDLGWCSSLVSWIQKSDSNLKTLLYLSNLSRDHPLINHQNCDIQQCIALTTLTKPRHRHPCTGHNCNEEFGLDQSQVIAAEGLISQNEIPILSLSKSSHDEKVSIELKAHGESTPYIAISHVWSDGLGNAYNNTLPACQWLYLWNVVSSAWRFINAEDGSSVSVWIDTICCPIQPRWAKRRILSRMRDIYENAKLVLVLDAELEEQGTDDQNNLELLARTLYSQWTTRLWTLQEAYLAKILVVNFKEKLVNFDQLFASLISTENTLAHKWVLKGSGIRRPLNELIGKPQNIELFVLVKSLEGRSVTHQADEPLCLATLLNLDLKTLVESDEDQRMGQFWKLLDQSPIGITKEIVFCEGPKLSLNSLKWAPSTLLSKGDDSTYYIVEKGPRAKLCESGLGFASAGFLLDQIHPDYLLLGCWSLDQTCCNGQFGPREIGACPLRDEQGLWSTALFPSKMEPDQSLAAFSNLSVEGVQQKLPGATILDIMTDEEDNACFGAILQEPLSHPPSTRNNARLVRLKRIEGNLIYVTQFSCFGIMPYEKDMSTIYNFAMDSVERFRRTNDAYNSYLKDRSYFLEVCGKCSQLILNCKYNGNNDDFHAILATAPESEVEKITEIVSQLQMLRQELGMFVEQTLNSNSNNREMIDRLGGNASANVAWLTRVFEYLLANYFHVQVQVQKSLEEQVWIVD